MSDPAEEFRKLAETTAALRRDVKAALEKSAPDHRRDFAEVLTALKKIEQKAAHDATPGMLREAAERGAANGAKEAIGTLWEASRMLRNAQERADEHASLWWRFRGVVSALMLFIGLAGGLAAGIWFANRLVSPGVIATAPGCAYAGGTFFPSNPPQQPKYGCVFWGE